MLPFTVLLNKLFAVPVVALLSALGLHPADPTAPIADYVAMQILVFLFCLVFFVIVRLRLSVDNPGATQHFFEMLSEMVVGQTKDMIGHGYERFLPYLVTLGLFVLLSNLLGLVPGFESPTANACVPLGCALITFVLYHAVGIRQHGFGYIKQFLGPVWWIAFLMFPIELCSHAARLMSLTIRLYANMFAGDMVTLAFFSLVPLGAPIAFLGLHLLVSCIQAFVFVMLTAVYVGGALAEEH
jgi:F-type H+-transporting ATPase subunit a